MITRFYALGRIPMLLMLVKQSVLQRSLSSFADFTQRMLKDVVMSVRPGGKEQKTLCTEVIFTPGPLLYHICDETMKEDRCFQAS